MLVPVWRNELGGLTFRGRIGAESIFVKWAPMGVGLDLSAERDRVLWAIAYTPVPVVLDYQETPDGELLVTRAIEAANAVSARWIADPAGAVRALAIGLRQWHDALPVADCPFDWSPGTRVKGRPGWLASGHPLRWTGWLSLMATRVHPTRCSPTTESPSPMSTCSDSEWRIGERTSQSLPATLPSTTVRVGSGCSWRRMGWSRTPVDRSTTSSSGIKPEENARRSTR